MYTVYIHHIIIEKKTHSIYYTYIHNAYKPIFVLNREETPTIVYA